KEIILSGIFGIYSKGLQIPSELKGLETEMIQNVALPLFAENMANAEAVAGAAQEDEGEVEQEGMEDEQQEMNQSQPQQMVA
ncbi:hypothetical protein OE181_25740, partial [Escherichia coli]|uniref:hypothetical protein n=1 Tax=Escherichia coli TaxID=562 RepID=UPI0021F323BF